MGELKTKTIKGVYWNGIERFSTLIIQLISTLVIARMLTPSDFGLIGMLYIFNALGAVIIDSGFSQALIRKIDADNVDYSSVFYFNIILSIVVYLILVLLSPTISKFYKTPELENVAKVSFLVLPLNAFSIIQMTILQKKMAFKKMAKISVIASILSGVIGILLAYYLKNVWALVYQTLFYNGFRTIMFWLYSKWRPLIYMSFNSIKEMGYFSFNLLLSGGISVIFDNLYTILIGKFYSSTDLGLYTQAKKIAEIPTLNTSNVIQQVSYPSMSQLKDNIHKLRENYRRIIELAVYIITPISGFLVLTAPDLFNLILGEKWKGAVYFFRAYCFIGVFYPVSLINLNILKVVGKSNILLKLELFKKILLAIILVYTIRISLTAVVIGNIIYAFIAVGINLYFCGKEIDLSVLKQIRDILPIYLMAIVIGGSISIVFNFFNFNNQIIFILTFFILYISLWIITSILFKHELWEELISIIKILIKSDSSYELN